MIMEMPTSGIYDYNPQLGSLYAQTYALYYRLPEWQRLFYYEPQGNDCANFASQCIWAAYGGWIPGMDEQTISQNRQRILQNVRQVGGVWHGSASNMGTLIWQRVNDLYSYIVTNRGFGPAGDLVAEGDWASIDPVAIKQGDLVQMVVTTYSGSGYGHSLFVTKPGTVWSDVFICSHSRDRLNTPMSEFASNPAVYPRLRVIRMREARFSQ